MSHTLLSVGYFISPQGGSISPFTIPADELFFEFITKGTVLDPIHGHLLGPGWVVVHHPGESTVFQSPPGRRYECLTARFTSRDLNAFRLARFYWEDSQSRNTFCHEVLHSYHHAEMNRDILGHMIWSQFVYRRERYRLQQTSKDVPPRLKRVLNHIEQHFADSLSIQDLGALVELSAPHLHAEFKKHMNTTPHQYLIETRMRESRHRLITTSDPIKAIASQVGYSNTENFCRAFKAHFKRTAADYRKTFSFQHISS